MNKRKIKAFWDAVPDKATLNQMVDGIDVSFEFDGSKYQVNTRIFQGRTRSIDAAYNTWDGMADNAEKVN